MRLGTLRNVIVQALKPWRFAVMANKVLERMGERQNAASRRRNLAWINSELSDFAALANRWDSSLWVESQMRCCEIKIRARETLKRIPYDLGGGGVYPFLHFLVRYMQPRNVVESGVAAGFSSYAFLDAMDLNKKGTLYSSDFPYFRLPDPERFIGILVPEPLKGRWRLRIEGDKRNLPRILEEMTGAIDFFHYDSDKSYAGRRYAMDAVKAKLAHDAVVIMDDIQDNSFFRDYVSRRGRPYWVFEFEGKFVGMVGEPARRSEA